MGIVKNSSLVLLLLVSALLILPYMIPGFEWTLEELLVLYGFGFACIILYFATSSSPKKGEKRPAQGKDVQFKTVTSVACYKCDFKEEREFSRGDYVGKTVGKCPKCNGESYIKTIYAIEEKKGKHAQTP
ncbi:MAG: hypothetical protein WED05_00310 [Candidatus Atabeyarchaeum deiterrae]